METVSVRVFYRPVRIGWCLLSGDQQGLREAWRISHALWGGRFNPIIPVDQPNLADRLVKAFRVDVIWPMSKGEQVERFVAERKHLPDPFYHDTLFLKEKDREGRPVLLDLRHPIRRFHAEYIRGASAPKHKVIAFEWPADDVLSDIFLAVLGDVPAVETTGIDYKAHLKNSLGMESQTLAAKADFPIIPDEAFALAALGRFDIEPHYFVRNNWDYPGFFYGDVSNYDDLVAFWNLRAAAISVMFYDPKHAKRFDGIKEKWSGVLRSRPKGRWGDDNNVAVWSRTRDESRDLSAFGKGLTLPTCDDTVWGVLNLVAPYMYISEGSSLAAVGTSSAGKPRISFQLPSKPFEDEPSNYMQHMVVAVDPGIGLFGDDQNTLHAPFIPELNEYYGRESIFHWNKARAEPETLGVITDANTNDLSLTALSVGELIQKIFALAGIEATPSKPGLIATRLIRQMGGLFDCRAFKIKGVRSLIEKYGPEQPFTRSAAVQLIRDLDETTGKTGFSEYETLHIEPRASGVALTPDMVLSFLLKKGLFRAGLQFRCPTCQLDFWRVLDEVSTVTSCEYCGISFNVTPHLRDRDWAYRRSGLFGRSDNQEGAIPVVLTLQQLRLDSISKEGLYTTGMELKSKDSSINPCETDFIAIRPGNYRDPINIIIGEAKNRMPITDDDVQKLKKVAHALEKAGFKVYVVLAKLAAFIKPEVQAATQLNEKYRRRVILWTDRELEPYFVYERTEK